MPSTPNCENFFLVNVLRKVVVVRKLSHDFFFLIDLVRGKGKLYIYVVYIGFSFPGKFSVFDRVFPSDKFQGNSRFQLRDFLSLGKGKKTEIFLSLNYQFLRPTLPSSIQNPPCSLMRFLTVFSVTPIASAKSWIVTFPFSLKL